MFFKKIKVTQEMNVHEDWFTKANDIKTSKQLERFVYKLINRYEHDYDSIINACIASMLAAYSVIENSPQVGITGFQASCIITKNYLENKKNASEEVKKHWQNIVDGYVPFGLKLEKKK